MVGLGVFFWEGRDWGAGGDCGDLVNKSAETTPLILKSVRH